MKSNKKKKNDKNDYNREKAHFETFAKCTATARLSCKMSLKQMKIKSKRNKNILLFCNWEVCTSETRKLFTCAHSSHDPFTYVRLANVSTGSVLSYQMRRPHGVKMAYAFSVVSKQCIPFHSNMRMTHSLMLIKQTQFVHFKNPC